MKLDRTLRTVGQLVEAGLAPEAAAAALEAVARSRRASLYQFFRWVWWPSLVCGCPARFVACQCGAACLLQVSLQPSVWPSG